MTEIITLVLKYALLVFVCLTIVKIASRIVDEITSYFLFKKDSIFNNAVEWILTYAIIVIAICLIVAIIYNFII